MTKPEIITAAEHAFNQFSDACASLKESIFFNKTNEKWSAAENMRHLIISTRVTTLAYRLPKFMVRLVAGKPNRPSRSYEELKARYYKKLDEGGKASGLFIPKPVKINYGKQKLADNWKKETTRFIKAIKNNRDEKDLDNYLARHPLLGRITLRELCYFTIFHTQHHLQAVHKISANQ